MTDTAEPEPLLHKEKLTEQGWPTGHALCDTGDGTFDGGALAHNSSMATCEKCADWEHDEDDEADEETPEPARYCALCERVEYGPACPNQRTDGRQP